MPSAWNAPDGATNCAIYTDTPHIGRNNGMQHARETHAAHTHTGLHCMRSPGPVLGLLHRSNHVNLALSRPRQLLNLQLCNMYTKHTRPMGHQSLSVLTSHTPAQLYCCAASSCALRGRRLAPVHSSTAGETKMSMACNSGVRMSRHWLTCSSGSSPCSVTMPFRLGVVKQQYCSLLEMPAPHLLPSSQPRTHSCPGAACAAG